MEQPAESQPFVVLTIFTSSPQHRQQFVDLIHDFASVQAMSQPGIISFEIMTDEGQEHIVTLSKWKDRDSFEVFKRSGSSMRASVMARVLTPVVYFLHPEAALPGTELPLRRAG